MLATSVQTQNAIPKSEKRAQVLFDKALASYRTGDLAEAKKLLLKSIDRSKTFVDAYLLLGDLETGIKQVPEAEKAYKEALNIDPTGHPKAWYLLAQLQFRQGEYSEGSVSIQHFLRLAHSSEMLKQEAEHLLESCDFSAWAIKNPVPDTLRRLADPVNSPGDEYVNFVDNNGHRMIFTRKELLKTAPPNHPVYGEQIYVSNLKNKHWETPSKVNFPWLENLNIGAVSFSLDGRNLYFTGCYWPSGNGSCDIYVSHLEGAYWETPNHLNQWVNTSSWDSQAVISSDGRYLYFASKRPGGKGGSDLWVSKKEKSGQWCKPENLGDSINTSEDEMAPFLHADGRTLYFSSNGWPSLGGYDLFVSHKKADGTWSKARNLGYPVNSRFDEINIFVAPDGNKAWISSSRIRKNGFDIFEFTPDRKLKPGKVDVLTATVLDGATHLPLKATAILSALPDGKIIDSLESSDDGKFMMALPLKENYALHVFKKGYLFFSDNINLLNDSLTREIKEKILLQPVAAGNRIRLENIYFKFDQSELSTAAFPELNRLVMFLKQNSGIQVQISGFTDNVGTAAYNLKLSLDRAKAVYDFLVMRGISPSRLSRKGYGNTEPVADNTTTEGRAKNRRTEIVVRTVSN